MASLTIDCFLDCDHVLGRRKNLPLQLEFCPLHTKDSPPSNEQWRMVSTLDGPCLAMSNQVSLFRLQLIRPNVEPVDAVLKIDHSGQRCHELKAEATAYRALLVNFQGKIIPKFYGCFATVINDRHITCLITEYSGEPLHTYLATTDAAFLTKLLNAVIHLHHCGAEHGDLDENNILTAKDGRPILIDLERVKPHSCQRRLEFRQGVIAPTEEEFGCPELYDLCMRMGYWQSRRSYFEGAFIAKLEVTSLEWLYELIPDSARAKPETHRAKEYFKAAAKVWRTIQEERKLTWGTLDVTGSTKRLDDSS